MDHNSDGFREKALPLQKNSFWKRPIGPTIRFYNLQLEKRKTFKNEKRDNKACFVSLHQNGKRNVTAAPLIFRNNVNCITKKENTHL